MRKSVQTFGLSLLIITIFLGIVIGFLFGIDNPVPWILIAVLIALPFIHKKMVARRFVEWNDNLSVRIGVIDDDHRKLLNLINNLQSAVYYSTGEAFERKALDELVSYTKYHFSREEGLMRDNGYPEYEEHKRQHDEMIDKVGEFLAAYEKDNEGAIERLTQYLKRWLLEHIAGTDQRYSQFLNEKGVH